jgi:hypothetical protein
VTFGSTTCPRAQVNDGEKNGKIERYERKVVVYEGINVK